MSDMLEGVISATKFRDPIETEFGTKIPAAMKVNDTWVSMGFRDDQTLTARSGQKYVRIDKGDTVRLEVTSKNGFLNSSASRCTLISKAGTTKETSSTGTSHVTTHKYSDQNVGAQVGNALNVAATCSSAGVSLDQLEDYAMGVLQLSEKLKGILSGNYGKPETAKVVNELESGKGGQYTDLDEFMASIEE